MYTHIKNTFIETTTKKTLQMPSKGHGVWHPPFSMSSLPLVCVVGTFSSSFALGGAGVSAGLSVGPHLVKRQEILGPDQL